MGKGKRSEENLLLTKRDVAILEFINEFGFCEIEYLQKKFSLAERRAYQVMKRLAGKGVVEHERIFYGRPGIFRLTDKGAEFTGLPKMKSFSRDQYEHQLMVIDVHLRLMQLYPGSIWISERELKKEKFRDGLGARGHLADGMLILPDEKKIAVEVELSQKGKDRLSKILRNYATRFKFDEVWYFCATELVSFLKSMASSLRLGYVKVHDIREFLA